MVKLTTIRLAGWKSIRETAPPIQLNNLNILIGSNGAGKSNLLSYFRMLAWMVDAGLQDFIAISGGMDGLLHFGLKNTDCIVAALDFVSPLGTSRYSQRLKPQPPVGLVLSKEQLEFTNQVAGDKPPRIFSLNGHHESFLNEWWHYLEYEDALPIHDLMSKCSPLHFLDTSATAAVRLPCYIEANRQLAPDAGNLAAMLYLYKQTHPVVYRRILNAVQLVAPYFDQFILEPRRLNPREILLNWKSRGSEYEFGPHQISDGTLRFIALTTLLLQPETDLPPLLVLDEPELGLHPAALGILAGMMKQASVHCQILAATQSTSLLDHFDFNDVIVANNRDGTSTFERLNRDDYAAWLEDYSLGDLWERNVIGGGPY